MGESSREGMRRRDFVRTSAAGVAIAGLPLLPAAARADAPPHPPGPPGPPTPMPKPPEPLPKYRTDRASIDMSRTYANPLNLPNIEVRTNTSTMAPTDPASGTRRKCCRSSRRRRGLRPTGGTSAGVPRPASGP